MEFLIEFSSAAGGVYGSTLSPKEVAGQALVTKGRLAAGIALNALDNPVMKKALLPFEVRLPSATHLANYIPFILSEEVRKTIGGDVLASVLPPPCSPNVSYFLWRGERRPRDYVLLSENLITASYTLLPFSLFPTAYAPSFTSATLGV